MPVLLSYAKTCDILKYVCDYGRYLLQTWICCIQSEARTTGACAYQSILTEIWPFISLRIFIKIDHLQLALAPVPAYCVFVSAAGSTPRDKHDMTETMFNPLPNYKF